MTRTTSRARLAVLMVTLLGLLAGIVILSPATATAAPEPAPAPAAAPGTFTWAMAPRFGADADNDHLIDMIDLDSPPTAAEPTSWRIDFDACGGTGAAPPGTTFSWTFPGAAPTAPSASCTIGHDFAEVDRTYDVALTVSSAAGTVTATQTILPRDHVIVIMGDSASSGEGNPDWLDPDWTRTGVGNAVFEPKWNNEQCHRSALSGPAQAALRLEQRDPHSSITFVHVGCSGARITRGLLNPYQGIVNAEHPRLDCDDPTSPFYIKYPDTAFDAPTDPQAEGCLPSQIDQVNTILPTRAIDAVSILAGINDVFFSKVIYACLMEDDCSTEHSTVLRDPANRLQTSPEFIGVRFAQLQARYRALFERVMGEFELRDAVPALGIPDGHVFLGEYPNAAQQPDGAPCTSNEKNIVDETAPSWVRDTVRVFLQGLAMKPDTGIIDSTEWAWAESALIERLVTETDTAVATANATWPGRFTKVSGSTHAFDQHGYCAKDTWFRSVGASFLYQRDPEGSFHPNRAGHFFAYALPLEAQLATQLGITAPALPPHVPGDTETIEAISQTWAPLLEVLGRTNIVAELDKIMAIKPGLPDSKGTDWSAVLNKVGSVTKGVLDHVGNTVAAHSLSDLDVWLDDPDGINGSLDDGRIGDVVIDIEGTISPHTRTSQYEVVLHVKARGPAAHLDWSTAGLRLDGGGSDLSIDWPLRFMVRPGDPALPAYLDVAGTPGLTIGLTAEQELPASAGTVAQLGPIDVVAHGPAGGKAVDIDTGLTLRVTDPSGDGKLTVEEMTGAAFTSLLTVTCTPGSRIDVDVALAAGLPGLTGELARFQLHDANVCDGISPPSIVFADPDLAGIQNLGPRDALDAFSALAAALERLQAAGRINLPFTSAQLADAVALAAEIRTITEDPAAAAGLSLQTLVARVEQALGVPAGSFRLRYDAAAKRFLLDVDLDTTASTTFPIDAGVLDAAGVIDAATAGTVAVEAAGHAHLGLAIDTTADPAGTPTEQLRSMSDRLLVSTDSTLTLDGSASIEATLAARVGFMPVELALDDGAGEPQPLLVTPNPAQPLARIDVDGPGAYVSVADLLTGDPSRAGVTATLNAALPPTTVRARALLGATELGHGALTIAWPDLSQLSGPSGPQVSADAAFSQQILSFAETANDPVALIGMLLGGVRDGAAAVSDVARRNEQLARSLPLIGSNYDDVVAGFAAVAKAADDLAALRQQLTLPELEAALERAIATALNVPVASVADKITLGLEPSASGIGLGLHVNLCQASAVSEACAAARPVGGTFAFDANGLPIVAARGQAAVSLGYLASLRLDLVLQLPAVALGDATDPLPHVVQGQPGPALYVLGSTGVDASFGADVAGTVSATVGPYAVALGMTGTKGGAPYADPANAHVRMRVRVGTGGPADERLTITDYIAAVVANLEANGVTSAVSGPCSPATLEGCADLPVYFKTTAGDVIAPDGSKWVKLGTDPITFRAAHLLDPGGFQVNVPAAIGDDLATRAMSLSSVLTAIQYLIDQLRAATDGVNVDQSLPIVGKAYAAGSTLLAELDALVARLQALAAVLDGQNSSGNVRTQLQTWLFTNLGPSGLKLLLDANGSGTVTIDDVVVAVRCGGAACAAAAPVTDITDVQIAVPLGKVAATSAPKIDFGVPGLKLVSDSSASASIGWHVDLAVGIDRDGVYVLTDGLGGRPEAGIDVKASLPDELNATIAGLPIAVTDLHDGQDVDISLGVDIHGAAGERKRLTELVRNLNDRAAIGFTIKGCADLHWGFEVRVPGVTNPDALPAISGEIALHADWAGCAGSAGAPRDLRDGIAPVGSAQIRNVRLDIGKTASRTVGRVLAQLQKVTSPVQPAVDRITSPIPVVSDLAQLVPGGPDDVTWLDAWKASQDVSGNDVSAIVTLVNLTDFINSYNPNLAPNVVVPIVDDLSIDLTAASRAYADPDQALDALIVGTPVVNDVLADAAAAGWTIESDLDAVVGESRAAKFSFPVLEQPSLLLQMLFGKDVDIAVFDAGSLHAEQSFDFFFGLPFAKVGIRGEASVDGHFAVSYDTAGIRRALAKKPLAWSSAGALVHGLGLNDLDPSGSDVPEIRFDASLAAYAYAGFPGANVEVSGGVRGYVQADLVDPDGDGKVRYEEIAKRIRNPRCFFATEGEIEAFLQVKGQLGPFTGTKDIVEPYTLLAFNSVEDWCKQAESGGGGGFEPVPPPVLASPTNPAGYWNLHVGTMANMRNIGGGADEKVTVVDLGDGRVRVSMFGADQIIGSTAQPVVAISGIALDGNDELHVEGPNGPGDTNIKFTFQGNAGDDVIEGGNNDDQLIGGDGTDRISGRGGNDTINAGDGNDNVKGGAGNDIILGDGTAAGGGSDVIDGGDGNDTISPMWGADVVDGGAGNDTINGSTTFVSGGAPATGPDRIVGGDGADTLWGSAGDDVIIGGVGGTGTGGYVDRIDGREGADCIVADGGQVAIVDGACRIVADQTTGENDWITGGAGADTIHAGSGDDRADGNSDSGSDTDPDTVWGGLGVDLVLGGGGNDTLAGDEGGDTIDGQDGDDVISGGDGGDTIRGGKGADRIAGDGGNDSIWGAESAQALVDGGDIVDGGAGVDTIVGGHGDDWIAGGEGDDSVKGDDGADQVFGGAGGDLVEGNGGNDVVRGGPGDDRISGGGGDDLVDGGEGNDLVGGGIVTYTTLTPATWPSGAQHAAANFDLTAGGTDTVIGGPGDDFEYAVQLTPPSATTQSAAKYTITDPADHGSMGVSATSFRYTPNDGYKGDDTFSYTLTVDNQPAGAGTATITNGTNRPPVAVDDTVTTEQSRPVAGTLLGNDTDPDGDTLVVTAASGTTPNGGGWTVAASGSFTYTPLAAFAGTDSFGYTVGDGHGATATATVVVTVRADVVAPLVHCPAVDGWSATEVSVTCVATDGGTGISGPPTVTLTSSTGAGNEGFFALDPPAMCDVAGNCTDLPSFAVHVDRKPPSIASATAGASYVQGIPAVLDLVCADGGSGLAIGACAAAGAPLDTTSLGAHTVAVSAADAVGNTATATITYTVTGAVDVVAPVVTCPAPTGWSATEVTVRCTAVDAGSGLAVPSQASFSLVTAIGAGREGTASLNPPAVCDRAGNCTDLPAFGVRVDRRAPTITSPNQNRSYQQGAAAPLSLVCTDAGSGLAAGACASAGVNLDTTTVGRRTLVVRAADRVGNTAALTISYTVTPRVVPPKVSVSDVSVTEGSSGFKNVSVPVTLTAVSRTTVTVRYRVTYGTATSADASLPVGIQTVTFPAGTVRRTIPVSIRGDRLDERNETVKVTIVSVTGATVGRAAGTVTIVDDD